MKDVKNNLINQSLLEKKLKEYKEAIQDNSQIFLKWHNETRNERKIQANFLNDIFGNILGYEFETDKEEYNLDYEQATDKSRKPVDGVLGFFTKENRKIKVIIELKGKDTKNINTIEQQAFDYLKEFSDVDYIITSNTETIRLYSKKHMSVKYIEWTMNELSKNLEKQKEFHFFLAKGRLFAKEGISEVAKLIEENIKEEKEIKDKFYKEYKEKRVKLINEIKSLNPSIDAISKAQKLLDRMLFIRFCIDRGYITQNIVKTVENLIKLRFTFYEALKVLFETIDKGSGEEVKDDFEKIIAWNGGLFAEDIELNDLQIGSEILKEIDKFFKSYNFSSQVDVHILGHIFEQSISDIEKLKEGNEFDKKQSKRKKDGVFYTPEYITQYIAQEAVGGWLNDRKIELNESDLSIFTEEELEIIKTDKKIDKKIKEKAQKHFDFWKNYAEKLKQIKVLDPACGSGAFLVEVFNFLESEWQIVNEKINYFTKIIGTGSLFEINHNYKDTLKNNIYGVDINFESVQITRLSLWIQTAHNKTALVSLDNNIKCGNSLIDDPEIAGEKAFNWEEEFPFKFDVIVGNPPYVGISDISIENRRHYEEKYKTAISRFDLYSLFIEQAFNLSNGYLSFIIPVKYLSNIQFTESRKALVENGLVKIASVEDKVFDEAQVDSIILIFKKDKDLAKHYENYNFTESSVELIAKRILPENEYIFHTGIDGSDLISKIEKNTIPLEKIAEAKSGIVAGRIKDLLFLEKPIDEFSKPLLFGKDIERYGIQKPTQWVNYKTKEMKEEELKRTGKGRIGLRMRHAGIFERPKILIRQVGSSITANIENDHLYYDQTIHGVHIADKKYDHLFVLAIFNSKLFKYYYKTKNSAGGKIFPHIHIVFLEQLPIKITPPVQQQPLSTHAQTMLSLTKQLNEIINSFYDYLLAKFGNPTKDLSKLKNWHKLDNSSFLELINKIAKTQKISIDDEALLGKFKEKISITSDLQNKISQTDSEIDKMVYALYGLSEKEIGVVESVS